MNSSRAGGQSGRTGSRAAGGRPREDRVVEIAKHVHVTPATVRSFFSRPETVAAPTRRAIALAVAAYGYRPRPKGRPLARRSFGFELVRPWSGVDVNSVFARMVPALALELEVRGAALSPFVVNPVVPGYTHTAVQEPAPPIDERLHEEADGDPTALHQGWLREYGRRLAPHVYEQIQTERKLDGFFIMDPEEADPRVAALTSRGTPCVVVGSAEKLAEGHVFVDVDDASAFKRMTEGLLRQGCTRLLHYGYTSDRSGPPARRHMAVEQALGSRGLLGDLHLPYEAEGSAGRLEEWLATYEPDGVICDSDFLAAQVSAAALRIGRNISTEWDEHSLVLAGSDKSEARDAAPVRWMTMEIPFREWARQAVDMMSLLLSGQAPASRMIQPDVLPAERLR